MPQIIERNDFSECIREQIIDVPFPEATGEVVGEDALMLGENVGLPVAQIQEQTVELDKGFSQECNQRRGVKETVVLLAPQFQLPTLDEEDCGAAR